MDESLGDLSRRVDDAQQDTVTLDGRLASLSARIAALELDCAVFQAATKPWIDVVRGLCTVLGVAAAAGIVRLILKS